MKHYDVLVIGGGHAGVEAASAAARMGRAVALVTMSRTDLGALSCNPAIGGLGKGHIVCEIDAMGGIMSRAADYSGIQFRLLNRSRGPAVRGPRAQVDRARYSAFVRNELEDHPGLDLIYSEVAKINLEGGRVRGVDLSDGSALLANTVVLTTGTFLGGVIHVGGDTTPAGRLGDKASNHLSCFLRDLGIVSGRLKTGTPARLNGATIDWSKTTTQFGDQKPAFFSWRTKAPHCDQVSCGLAETNVLTHEIVRENLALSAMRSGKISGVGPRYCPSIEDKVERFPDKTSHQIFLEPEGLDVSTIYPNGLSTSLPREVQERVLRSISGLENVEILRFGYAIEYDYCDPSKLKGSLESKLVDGLFFAGQINGTTGYEEAAGQGLVAGLNAALYAQGESVTCFDRAESYIGVMIDDLTRTGVSEPYRMFTSRAEYRLRLRVDNADQRLTSKATALGLLKEEQRYAFEQKLEVIKKLRSELLRVDVAPTEMARFRERCPAFNGRKTVYELLSISDLSALDVKEITRTAAGVDSEILELLKIESGYAQYVERQEAQVERSRAHLSIEIPDDFTFDRVGGLSTELRQKLTALGPVTIEEASRIEGMTPAALMALIASILPATKPRRYASST